MATKEKTEEQTALQKFFAGLNLVSAFAGSPLVRIKLEKGKTLILSSVGEGTNASSQSLVYRLPVDPTLQLTDFDIGSFTVESGLLLKAVFGRVKNVKPTDTLKMRAMTPEHQSLQLKWSRSTATIPLHIADEDTALPYDAKKSPAISSSVLTLVSNVLKRAQLSLADTPSLGLCPVSRNGKRTASVDVVLYGPYACIVTRMEMASVMLAERVCPNKFVTIPAGVMQTFMTLAGRGEDVSEVLLPVEANVCVVSSPNCVVLLKKQDAALDLSLEDITELTTAAFSSISSEKTSCLLPTPKLREAFDAAEAFSDVSMPVPAIQMQYTGADVRIDSSLNQGTKSSQKLKVLTGKTGKNAPAWAEPANVPIRPAQKLLGCLPPSERECVRISANDTTLFMGWQEEKAPKAGTISGGVVCLRLVAG